MSAFLLALVVAIAAFVLLQLGAKMDPKRLAKIVRVGGAGLAGLLGAGLLLIGRVGFAIPLFMAAFWLMGWPLSLPGLRQRPGTSGMPPPRGGRSRPQNSTMTREQALEILGLDASAGYDDIRRAHKQLMQKLHPDHGGSTHLAAEVNAAKDFLLNE